MPPTTVNDAAAHRGGGVPWLNRAMRRSRFPLSASFVVVSRSETALPLSDAGERRMGRERPPPKQGGHAVLTVDGRHASTGPHGVAHVLIYRIGPRRQGFASPLRALDGSGPIRKTRCLRGERGGRAVGREARGIPRVQPGARSGFPQMVGSVSMFTIQREGIASQNPIPQSSWRVPQSNSGCARV